MSVLKLNELAAYLTELRRYDGDIIARFVRCVIKDEEVDVIRVWPNGLDGLRTWNASIEKAEQYCKANDCERWGSEFVIIER